MRQILQSLKTGLTEVVDVPCPRVRPGHLLIRTTVSLVSAGTERMLVEFGKANFLDKARQQPDKVRMVLDKIKTDGLLPTIETVRNKLDQPMPMGYCNVGIVMEVGPGVTGFAVGDRVVSNGNHSEVVCVPTNLCCKIPEGVSDEEAAFTVIGAIGLQGIRLAQPTLGETVVVTGLGLIGLVTVQLLRANGCRVLGIDFDPKKLALARSFGAETVDLSRGEDPVTAAYSFSRGRGVDAVIITAATKSNEPVHQAALMCRKKGRIVLVGVVGLELSRADFYEKELSFQVSCSYGPGRYDPVYEQGGQDYPVGYVRWTEQRNFEAVLDMLALGNLQVAPLVSHKFPLEAAGSAYELMGENAEALGILLQYPNDEAKPDTAIRADTVKIGSVQAKPRADAPTLAMIGAGNYATSMLIPSFKRTAARFKSIASNGGVSAVTAGRKFSFEQTTTNTAAILQDPEVDAVVVTTRHDSHASFVTKAFAACKHVFVEKPLAVNEAQLTEVVDAYKASLERGQTPVLMVGFNRRFAPQVVKMKELLAGVRVPKCFIYTVNAGAIPLSHWTQDKEIGGGRIIGEACHFIDLLRYLTGAPITDVKATVLQPAEGPAEDDKVTITLSFADGSFGTIHYLANGHKSVPKERLEVFCAGRILQLDNFRKLRGFGWPGFTKFNLWRQDKGQTACADAFVKAIVSGESSPISIEELIEVTRVSFEVAECIRQ